jgi:hypothetical protein
MCPRSDSQAPLWPARAQSEVSACWNLDLEIAMFASYEWRAPLGEKPQNTKPPLHSRNHLSHRGGCRAQSLNCPLYLRKGDTAEAVGSSLLVLLLKSQAAPHMTPR